MKSCHVLGRAATGALSLLMLAVTLAAAGPRPELDATAGLRPSLAVRSLAQRTRASAALSEVATPTSFDERYDVPKIGRAHV